MRNIPQKKNSSLTSKRKTLKKLTPQYSFYKIRHYLSYLLTSTPLHLYLNTSLFVIHVETPEKAKRLSRFKWIGKKQDEKAETVKKKLFTNTPSSHDSDPTTKQLYGGHKYFSTPVALISLHS